MLDDVLVPSFAQMLRALAAWLDKAAAHPSGRGETPDALLARRLAPDMLPLSSQVRFACLQAREGVHRLRGEPIGEEAERLRVEGWGAREHAGTLGDAKARIAETLAFLDDAARRASGSAVDRPISLELPNGMIFDMSGQQYARDWLLPQFYFHVVTAYAILRGTGIELGKADLVPHMFAYLRPGTAPAA